MSFQNLPPELVLKVFRLSDNFRTATALSATSSYFHSIWLHHTEAILQEITPLMLLHAREANMLADRYEEIFAVVPTADRGVDAVRRVKTLLEEQRIILKVTETSLHSHHHFEPFSWPDSLPPELDQPENFLKLAYRIVNLIVSHDFCAYRTMPISLHRRAFQNVSMRKLQLLRTTLLFIEDQDDFTIWQGCNDSGCAPLQVLARHFGPAWPEEYLGLGNRIFWHLRGFLEDLYDILRSSTSPEPGRACYLPIPITEPEKPKLWGKSVEDLLTAAPCCTIEGDLVKIDLTKRT